MSFIAIILFIKRYSFTMQLTDRIRQVKIFLVLAAIIIAVASLIVSNNFVRDLAKEERNKMEIWAEAMRSFNNADETTDLGLVLKVINENHTIPIVVVDSKGKVQICRNVDVDGRTDTDSVNYVTSLGKRLYSNGRYIRIDMEGKHKKSFIYVCYDDSSILKRLLYYPYVQLGVVLIFVVVAIFALLTSKRAEQNKVWVGLSKETAHQLGTPISSLMAWIEILKESYPDDVLIPEMDKDVKRLQLIADRFSKIGSLPEPVSSSLNLVVQHVVDYMDRRTSSKVLITQILPDNEVVLKLNASLFEWVIENLCKNAVDAMEGEGHIIIEVHDTPEKAIIDVTDNGKGIKKKNVRNVFKPGFTTKKRGWGLGLSLAKRIVEEYHNGRIFVKRSEIGVGTTFRIEMRK